MRELVPAESWELNTVGYSDEFHSGEEGGSCVEGNDAEGGWDRWFEGDMEVFWSCHSDSDSTFVESLRT